MMSSYKTEWTIQNLKDHPLVQKNNMTDQEIEKFYENLIWTIETDEACKNHNSNECINTLKEHGYFFRDPNGYLCFGHQGCPKYISTMNLYTWLQKYNVLDVEIPNQKVIKYKCRREVLQHVSNEFNSMKIQGGYVWGPEGVGKTFMMSRFSLSWVKKGKNVSFINATKILDLIYKNKSSYNEESYLLEMIKDDDVIYIDNLGFEKFSYYSHIKFFMNLFKYRKAKSLPVYFISNYPLDKLEKYYNRVIRNNPDVTKEMVEGFIYQIKSLSGKNIFYIKDWKNNYHN